MRIDRTKSTFATLAIGTCIALPAPAGAVVEFGASGPAVTSLQTLLSGTKFYTGPIDGKFGGATFNAVLAFQNANGLEADGVAGSGTWTKLLPGAPYQTIREGSKDAGAVRDLQNALKISKVDGKFGRATREAVIAFQRRSGIRPTGIVGPDTWHVLSLK